MSELFLPRTDGGVLVQAVAVGLLCCGVVAATWRWSDVRFVVAGASLVVLGLIGIRALH